MLLPALPALVMARGGSGAADEPHLELETMDAASLGRVLRDATGAIGPRMRSVFFLRTQASAAAVRELATAIEVSKGDSSLLRHEIGYCLGQLQDRAALPSLERVLRDKEDCPVVRHECAEAIAAIGDLAGTSKALLAEFVRDARPEVSETCRIAVDRFEWLAANATSAAAAAAATSPDASFSSVDPAPALTGGVPELEATLLDPALPLFVRYQAMFGLRNIGGEAAVLAICRGLRDRSALFRHEVAFILGQMAAPCSFHALKRSLQDLSEHAMVRHESAEAVGAIVESLDDGDLNPSRADCVQLLTSFLDDPEPLVADSCVTALDSIDYWRDFATAGGDAAADEPRDEPRDVAAAAEAAEPAPPPPAPDPAL